MRLFGAILVFAGCHAGGMAAPDAPPEPDAFMPQSLGIFVGWHADPALPGTLDDHLTVTDATFHIAAFEVIGDAGPGDSRTTRLKYSVAWDPSGTPTQETFPDAPVGLYSKITVDMAGSNFGDFSYQIQGTYRDSGIVKPFWLIDYARLGATIDCQQALAAGSSVTIPISFLVADALSGLDFRRLTSINGVLMFVGPLDPQLVAFHDRMAASFKVDDGDDTGGEPGDD
jgi:hypothetical protein